MNCDCDIAQQLSYTGKVFRIIRILVLRLRILPFVFDGRSSVARCTKLLILMRRRENRRRIIILYFILIIKLYLVCYNNILARNFLTIKRLRNNIITSLLLLLFTRGDSDCSTSDMAIILLKMYAWLTDWAQGDIILL